MRPNRVRILGYLLAAIGLVSLVVGGVAMMKVQDGYHSLGAYANTQDVRLSYNEEGQLIDRGTTEGADAIMALLRDDYGFHVNERDLDADDPVVDTVSEFMYQMATVSYHTLHGTQTVVLAEDKTYDVNGDGTVDPAVLFVANAETGQFVVDDTTAAAETFPAGSYSVPVAGRYYSQLNRSHPLEGPVRTQAWSGLTLALIGVLAGGAAAGSTIQVALGVAVIFLLFGVVLIFTGFGLWWTTRPEKVKA